MKNEKKIGAVRQKRDINDVVNEISVAVPTHDLPTKAIELADTYGTYEIQNTADTENQYPAIAQGFNEKIVSRDCENSHHGKKWENRDE